MPPAFRNASIPLSAIHGDTTSLPVVNRVPLRGIILGKENTMRRIPNPRFRNPIAISSRCIARWDDRVVFAFPLLVAMQRLDLPLDGMEIRLGEYLKLSPDGPIVPIDRFGRLGRCRSSRFRPMRKFPPRRLIDGGDDLFPKRAPEPVILRDDRSAAEPATRKFSEQLSHRHRGHRLGHRPGARTRFLPETSAETELILLAVIVLVARRLCRLPRLPETSPF